MTERVNELIHFLGLKVAKRAHSIACLEPLGHVLPMNSGRAPFGAGGCPQGWDHFRVAPVSGQATVCHELSTLGPLSHPGSRCCSGFLWPNTGPLMQEPKASPESGKRHGSGPEYLGFLTLRRSEDPEVPKEGEGRV